MRSLEFTLAPVGQRNIPCVLPVYSAEPTQNIDRGHRPYSIVEVLKGNFKENFDLALQKYADDCLEGIRTALKCPKAILPRLVRARIIRVDADLKNPTYAMPVDLLMAATFSVCIPTTPEETAKIAEELPADIYEKRIASGEFRMRYLLDMRHCKRTCSAPIIAPAECFPGDNTTEQKGWVANQYLLPILRSSDYGKFAHEMLNAFYREALIKPTAVDGRELARRMGLQVITVCFAEEEDILGRIYFDHSQIPVLNADGTRSMMQIKPSTILINEKMCRTREVENSTIIHECVHMYKDRCFFLLQMMTGKSFCSYTSRKRIRLKRVSSNGPVEWMELQAEKLPAYILMEENNTRAEIERMLSERGGDRSPETFNWILGQLAGIFGVSKSMAKYRMIELGYPEAEGVYVYLKHGERVPDYGCSTNWEAGLTYTIAYDEAAVLFRRDAEFRELLLSADFTYAEGHFVLNNPTYVERSYGARPRLTSLARRNIEKCCIAFSVSGRAADITYTDGQAARKKPVTDSLLREHIFEAEPQSAERTRELDRYSRDALLWTSMLRDMPDSFREAVKKILEAKGISQENLAVRMGVTRAALNKWWSRERISKEHVVCICIALEVRADVSMELLRMTNNLLRNTGADSLYTMMLYDPRMTVSMANEILIHNHYPPLNHGENDQKSLSEENRKIC